MAQIPVPGAREVLPELDIFPPQWQRRWTVLLRGLLVIPQYLVSPLGWEILAVFFWLSVLILGRMPRPVFEATAAVVRYTMRAYAYFMMLTSAYPKWLFDGRALLIVIIVLGVLGSIGENISSAVLQNRDVSTDNTPDQNQLVATLQGY
jgi:hypothetical protein